MKVDYLIDMSDNGIQFIKVVYSEDEDGRRIDSEENRLVWQTDDNKQPDMFNVDNICKGIGKAIFEDFVKFYKEHPNAQIITMAAELLLE